jgi:signal transduction histidine kinase/CheY-like chemotaxis protein
MMKIKMLFKNFIEIFTTDEDTPELIETKRKLILAATIPSNIGTIIFSIMNIFTASYNVFLSTVFLSIGLLFTNIILFKKVPLKYTAISICLIVCPVFTYYVIAGGAGGFGLNWSLFIPIGIYMMFGLRVGLITSSYFLVLLFVCFYSPVKSILLYEYSDVVLQRFPILYSIVFIFSFLANFQLKALRLSWLEHKHNAEEARTRAELASESKTNFLATMSHEIRTPMNAIIGITQIELQKDNLTRERTEALSIIYNSGISLLNIINDILDLSKIETGKLELHPSDYDIPSLISDTAQINMVRIGTKRSEFLIDADRNLPSRLYGDELRLRQILNNLLSNAIKYTDNGYVILSISHSPDPDSPEDVLLHIAVKDTGQGMKQEDLDKLFSEYQRFNISANKATEGVGLGLSITQKLVEMMDGSINVQSEYGKGSTFAVTIKQKALESEVVGDEISNRLRNFKFTREIQSEKLKVNREIMPYGKVLVVDDVETNLYIASGLLIPYKLHIELAISGYEAIELVNSGKSYDIIFMDHMMPLMDGMETTHKLRLLGYNGTIVALTANALKGSAEMFLSNGFNGYLPKPVDIRTLNDILNEFIRDKYPEEAKKYKTAGNDVSLVQLPAINHKLLEVFRRDTLKAAKTIRETFINDDIKSFTTAAHAMKAALATVGEIEISKLAADLENAGLSGNKAFICANAESFAQKLETLAENLMKLETFTENIKPAESINDRMTENNISAPDAKILVVDDNEFNRGVTCGFFDLLNIKADSADSGFKAIELVRQNDYDIIFMDHMMPEMDGIETVNKIRKFGGKYEELIIIALTANTVKNVRDMFLSNGFNDFLAKPIKNNEL